MPEVIFIEPNGRERHIDIASGTSLMVGAVQGNVHGIDAECGGCCSCATCHIYVDPAFIERLPAADAMEDEMLSGAAAERRDSSRLSCQISMTPDLDGLIVTIPDRQF
ncbi:ferredoxin [Bosea caraganae]|uniref:Ferredoxin n=1 Tax=Bosea caraganae TaxID=2763117 RepID=A0A370KY68_9HYPH|nr:2Fe-2S iron-sulfur cluster-binding protein [Bosea caraganae]RDJ19918.1 ferredoxin [Bosea caraganae]RDJ23856.1 ferredoxin [Bosea caraganae]